MGIASAFGAEEYEARIDRLRQQMRTRGADVLIADTSEALSYLIGYDSVITLYRALVVPASGDPMMILRELDEAPFAELSNISKCIMFRDWDDPVEILIDYLTAQGFAGKTIAVDKNSYALTVGRFETLKSRLPAARFIDFSDEIMKMALIKSDAELEYLRAAARIADAVMADVIGWARAGITTRDVQEFASAGFFRHGADHGLVGPITEGHGENFLHGLVHRRPMERGEILHVELVPKFRGYSSRIMRSIVLGSPTDRQIEIVEKLIALQDRQFAAIRPGAMASEIDAICRQGAIDAGLRTRFNNLTAYTVGYFPAQAARSSNFYRAFHPAADWPLEAGMMFHAYMSAEGLGVSETILVTDDGCERLTQTERRLFSTSK